MPTTFDWGLDDAGWKLATGASLCAPGLHTSRMGEAIYRSPIVRNVTLIAENAMSYSLAVVTSE